MLDSGLILTGKELVHVRPTTILNTNIKMRFIPFIIAGAQRSTYMHMSSFGRSRDRIPLCEEYQGYCFSHWKITRIHKATRRRSFWKTSRGMTIVREKMFQQKTKNFGSSKQGYLLWIVTVMNLWTSKKYIRCCYLKRGVPILGFCRWCPRHHFWSYA